MTGTNPRRGPYAKTAGRIERILDVALDLFATKGYRATSMKEIAERVGLSQTGLMHHFPTKSDVLITLLERRDEMSPAITPEAMRLAPLERLLLAAQHIEDHATLSALQSMLAAEATALDHPAHEYFRNRYDLVISTTMDTLIELQRRGEMRADVDPQHLARIMIGVIDGVQVQWLLDPKSVDLKDVLRTFMMLCAAAPEGSE